MTRNRQGPAIRFAAAGRIQSRGWRRFTFLAALAATTGAALVTPGVAAAHGPVAPIASSYLARVTSAPPGLEAKIVDGDQLMWLRVRPGLTVVVLDYRGSPYLRFSSRGIEVNRNSAMYYLNQTPVSLTPPAGLGPATAARWRSTAGGTSYSWHDGRLHALASVALTPGARYVGRWQVPVLVSGRRTAIAGSLWHAGSPSVVWFWPIIVLLACVLAAWRLHRPSLDRRVAKGLGIMALIGLTVAVLARCLHGHPAISVLQMIELAAVLVFAAYAAWRLLFSRHGHFTYFVIAIVALWQGAELIPTLLQGFVLAAGPAFLARAASVVCLGSGIALLALVFRLADQREPAPASGPDGLTLEPDEDRWELV